MKRNPQYWTRKRLAELDYMYSVMDMSIETLAIHHDRSERAIQTQLQRLHYMHETTGTSYKEWYVVESEDE